MERPLERIYRTMMDVEETQQRLDKEMTNRLMQRAERWQYPVSYTHLDVYKRQPL